MAGSGSITGRGTIPYTRLMPPTDPDIRLMLRFRDGDGAAFDALYARHRAGLYRYLLRLCFDADAADDLFQETWAKVIAARRRYRPSARFAAYLYRVARNCFLDHCRKTRTRGREIDATAVLLQSPDADPAERADLLLARTHLDSLLRGLPAEQRDAFLLHEEGGLSIAEIAAITGVGAETAKSRLRYAYRKLRAGFEALEDGGHGS